MLAPTPEQIKAARELEDGMAHFFQNSAFVKACGLTREQSDKLFIEITGLKEIT